MDLEDLRRRRWGRGTRRGKARGMGSRGPRRRKKMSGALGGRIMGTRREEKGTQGMKEGQEEGKVRGQ